MWEEVKGRAKMGLKHEAFVMKSINILTERSFYIQIAVLSNMG